ncbi:hypothetical protein ABIE21_000925 [Conyzicola nivalis]|uniref:Lipocalin-like domain-containing protein n=1 Tax=Conyzicola nivalis TaxID=1477021 RepID=A0ABV2QK55_9MICO
MPPRRVVAVLAAATALISLSGCTAGSPDDSTSAVSTAQADVAGEWVVTRTVVSSNDLSNPAHVVGATSVRYVLVEREQCDDALCDGTVSSGATLEARESTDFVQTDGGFDYEFSGGLDCVNATTGAVVAVDGFDFAQKATLTVGETADVDGTPTASTLTGTISYTDTVTEAALETGCTRDPLAVEVEYAVAAVRAPAAPTP